MSDDVARPERADVAKVRIASIRLKPAHQQPGRTAGRYVYENGGLHKALFTRRNVVLWGRTE